MKPDARHLRVVSESFDATPGRRTFQQLDDPALDRRELGATVVTTLPSARRWHPSMGDRVPEAR
jgi:hypothetical protein